MKAKIYKNPIKWMLNQEVDNRMNVGVPLDANDYEKQKAVLHELNTLRAQLGKRIAEEHHLKEQEDQKEKEKEIKKDLNEQQKQLIKDKFGKSISLYRFFEKLMNDKKFKSNLELVDKDDHTVLGNFGDLRIISDGKYQGALCIYDNHNNPMIVGKSLNRIIYKPETFGNQLKRGRILLPVDNNFQPVLTEIEDLEMNDIEYNDETQEFQETKEYREKFKNLLMGRELEIREKSRYIERLELTQVSQRKELNDLKRTLSVAKNASNIHDSELTQMSNMVMQFNSRTGEMQRKISNLTDAKVLYENIIDRQYEIIKKVLEKLELYGDKTVYELTKAEVQQDLELYKNLLPETITQIMPTEETKIPVRLPGENLGVTGKVK